MPWRHARAECARLDTSRATAVSSFMDGTATPVVDVFVLADRRHAATVMGPALPGALSPSTLEREQRARIWTALRVLLAEVLGARIEDLHFDRSCRHCGDRKHGKPRVLGLTGRDVDFSLTHTPLVSLAAIGSGCSVGIDAEVVPSRANLHRWCYSPSELEWLASLSASERDVAAVWGWVRKEAFAKAVGRGLPLPLAAAELSGTSERWHLPDPRWHIMDLSIDGLAAAVAVDTPDAALRVSSVPIRRLLRANGFPAAGSPPCLRR